MEAINEVGLMEHKKKANAKFEENSQIGMNIAKLNFRYLIFTAADTLMILKGCSNIKVVIFILLEWRPKRVKNFVNFES